MKKYVISLEKDSDRRALFFAQTDTQDFTVFSAINTMQASEIELNRQFNLTQFKQHYGRSVTKGEIGCTLSHLAVYQLIVEDLDIAKDEYCLICEDDALFDKSFQKNMEQIICQPYLGDIVLLGQSKIRQFNDLELEINYPTTFQFLQRKLPDSSLTISYPYKNYFAGTVAYLIKKSAAEKFLNILHTQIPYWLADDFILFGHQFRLDIKIVRPLMVIENPNINSNLETNRGSISHHFIKKIIKYPLKKVLAVMRNLGK